MIMNTRIRIAFMQVLKAFHTINYFFKDYFWDWWINYTKSIIDNHRLLQFLHKSSPRILCQTYNRVHKKRNNLRIYYRGGWEGDFVATSWLYFYFLIWIQWATSSLIMFLCSWRLILVSPVSLDIVVFCEKHCMYNW